MGRWDYKIDFKNAIIPSLVFLILTFEVIYTKRFSAMKAIVSDTVKVSGYLHQYYQLVVSVLISFISIYVFGENYREGFVSYVRTLPLSLNSIWIFRYILFMACMTVLVGSTMYFSVAQANESINHILLSTGSKLDTFYLSVVRTLVSCMITINFSVLVTQTLMVLFKNRVIAMGVLTVYALMEYGPWGRFLGESPLFFGAVRPVLANVWIQHYQYLQIGLSVVLFAIITLWHYKKYS